MSKKSMIQFKQKFEVPKKEVKKKKNEVLAWILAGFMVLWTIMGVFGTIGFFKSRNIESVSASEVVEVVDEQSTTKRIKDKQKSLYVGSSSDEQVVNLDFCKGSQLVFSNNSYTFICTLLGEVDLILNGRDMFVDYSYVDTSSMVVVRERYSLLDDEFSFPIRFQRLQGSNIAAPFQAQTLFYVNWSAGQVVDTDAGDYLYSYQISSFTLDNNGTYNVSADLKVLLSFKKAGFDNVIVERELYVSFFLPATAISFKRFFVPTYGIVITEATSTFPVSYWQHAGDWVSSFEDYESGYQNGLIVGQSQGSQASYDRGYADGNADGYERGYDIGYELGEDNGFIQGVADANEYSFNGLLGAIFDVPVRTFQSLFNFEILGVDIGNFLLGLLTCLVILAVVKLIV